MWLWLPIIHLQVKLFTNHIRFCGTFNFTLQNFFEVPISMLKLCTLFLLPKNALGKISGKHLLNFLQWKSPLRFTLKINESHAFKTIRVQFRNKEATATEFHPSHHFQKYYGRVFLIETEKFYFLSQIERIKPNGHQIKMKYIQRETF